MQPVTVQPKKWQETAMFLFLSVMIWPIIACVFVGVYGFSWWIYFMLYGPPGPR